MSRTSGRLPATYPRATPTGNSWPQKPAARSRLRLPRRACKLRWRTGVIVAILLSSSIPALAAKARPSTFRLPNAQLEPLEFSQLAGWLEDDHAAAFAAFIPSCKAIRRRGGRDKRPVLTASFKRVCQQALKSLPLDGEGARRFFETNFRPVRVTKIGEAEGFLTGYWEPVVEGSQVRTAEHVVPMHRRPGDLIVSGSRRVKAGAFPNKGAKILRRLGKGKLAPYFDRAQIEDGALSGRNLEIAYLKDPIDAFFIHIQGSARVRVENGRYLRLNYDAHNGHPYTPVGRILIDRGIVPKEQMSMQRIREFMLANTEEGRALRRMNRSYVFFRVTKLGDHDEAIGAQGVQLTPGRSIAVDKALHMYGMPFWIEADLPLATEEPNTPFRRLMIAQDTGSAIVGPARADIYFGAGEEAGRAAGRIRHNGRFAMLLPKDIKVGGTALPVPLPRPRPQIEQVPVSDTPTPRARPGA